MFSASLGLPLPKQEGRETEAEERDHKGEEEKEERKNQKQKEKRIGKGQEGAQLPSKGKKEPRKPQAKKLGKRPRLESGSEQVGPSGRMASFTGKGEPSRIRPAATSPQPRGPREAEFGWGEGTARGRGGRSGGEARLSFVPACHPRKAGTRGRGELPHPRRMTAVWKCTTGKEKRRWRRQACGPR